MGIGCDISSCLLHWDDLLEWIERNINSYFYVTRLDRFYMGYDLFNNTITQAESDKIKCFKKHN